MTASLALSPANAKGKGINSEGWVDNQVFRLAKRDEEVRSLEEISKNIFGNIK